MVWQATPCSSSRISTCTPAGPRDTVGLPRPADCQLLLVADLHTGDSAPMGLQRTPWNSHTRKGKVAVEHAVDDTIVSQSNHTGYGVRQLGIEGVFWPIDDWTGVPRTYPAPRSVIGNGQVPLVLTESHAVDGLPGFWRGGIHITSCLEFRGDTRTQPRSEASEKEIGLLSDLQTSDLRWRCQSILLLTCHRERPHQEWITGILVPIFKG